MPYNLKVWNLKNSLLSRVGLNFEPIHIVKNMVPLLNAILKIIKCLTVLNVSLKEIHCRC